MTRDPQKEAAQAIWDDLTGRKGIGNELESCDDEIQAEINDRMAELIGKAYERLTARLAEAERVIEPFAAEAACWSCGNDERPHVVSWAEDKPSPAAFTVGDLRAAAAWKAGEW